ncbi:MAG: hypothetical protein GC134_08320 [Proteobacteria bacterium]|nr:hypothetical protein [Pseudomonadota bacterium]
MTIKSELVQQLGGQKMTHYPGAEVFRAASTPQAVEGYSNNEIDAAARLHAAYNVMHDAGHIANRRKMQDGSVELTFRDQSTLTVGRDLAVRDVTGAKPNSPFRLDGASVERLDGAMKDHFIEKYREEARAGYVPDAADTREHEQSR